MNQPKTDGEQQDSGSNEAPQPILIDLGKKRRKKVKQLRQGRGSLMDVVEETIAELKSQDQIEGNAQPVVVVVREKRKGRRRWGL